MRLTTLILTLFVFLWAHFSLASDKEFRKILEVGPKAGRFEIEQKADILMQALSRQMAVVSSNPEKSGKIFERMSEILLAKENLLLPFKTDKELLHEDNVKLTFRRNSDFSPMAQSVNGFVNSMSNVPADQLEKAYEQITQTPLSFWFGLGLELEEDRIDFNSLSPQMLDFLMKRLSDPPEDVSEFKDSDGLKALEQRWSKILLRGAVNTKNFDLIELVKLGDRYGVFNGWSERFLLVYKNVPSSPTLFLKVFESDEASGSFNEKERAELIKSILWNLFYEARTPDKVSAARIFVDQVLAQSSPKLAAIIKQASEDMNRQESVPEKTNVSSLSLLEKCRNIFTNIWLSGKRKPR